MPRALPDYSAPHPPSAAHHPFGDGTVVPIDQARHAERVAREARALAEATRNINQSLEVELLFPLIVQHASHLLDARAGRVLMCEGDALVVTAAWGDRDELEGSVTDDVALGAVALRSGNPARREDSREPSANGATNPGCSCAIAVPLRIADRSIGAIVVTAGAARTFDEQHEELLVSLCAHAAIAIENARLYHASVRAMRHASILAESARSLALHVTPDDIYADVWRLARSSLGADGIGIYLAESADRPALLGTSEGVGAEASRSYIEAFWRGAGAEVVTQGRPRFLSDVLEQEHGPIAVALIRDGVASTALLPLHVEGRPRGMLALRFRVRQSFEAEQQRLLLDFASLTAVGVHNTFMYADLEAQTARLRVVARAERREREEAEAAAGIARVALRAASTGAAATQILSIVESVVPAASSALALRREDGELRYVAVRGGAAELLDALAESQPATGDTPFRVVVAPCVSHTVLPLVSAEQALGVLALSEGPSGAEETQRRATLARLAAPLSLALASLLLREEERRVAEQLRQSERLAALGELIAGVAHEVNNPLTGISAFAQLLQEEPLTPDQLESVRLIKREADRAVAVMRDLLTFARKTGPRLVAVDVNELVEQTLRLRAYGLRTNGIDVRFDAGAGLRPVRGDDRQLQQVILNLVVNAEHAMIGCERRMLTITTRAEGDQVIAEVRDSGMGMSPEVLRRILEPFFTTKPDGRGTGLGLSVSYGIIRSHHGTLEVESAPGTGSTFRVSLPSLAHYERVDPSYVSS